MGKGGLTRPDGIGHSSDPERQSTLGRTAFENLLISAAKNQLDVSHLYNDARKEE